MHSCMYSHASEYVCCTSERKNNMTHEQFKVWQWIEVWLAAIQDKNDRVFCPYVKMCLGTWLSTLKSLFLFNVLKNIEINNNQKQYVQ